MKYIDYINQFWKVNEELPFTAKETQFYFFLLNECNRQRWQMPFKCTSYKVGNSIGMNRQTLSSARTNLKEQGLIDFELGRGNVVAPIYRLLDMAKKVTDNLTYNLTNDLTDNLTIIKSNKNKDIILSHNGDNDLLLLEELQRVLLLDIEWQGNLKDYVSERGLSPVSNAELVEQIALFFKFLCANGTEKKGLSDCKKHFLNWLCCQIKASQRKSVRTANKIGVVLTDDNVAKFKDIKGW